MPQNLIQVGVVFGGVSPEHEVSVISALQAAAVMDRSKYHPIPIYIAKDGAWYTGARLLDIESYQDLDALRSSATRISLETRDDGALDIVEITSRTGWFAPRPFRTTIDLMFLGLHGGEGENGGLQGLCETFNVPFTGSSVFGSALGMDKVLSKMVCRDQDIPIVPYVWFRETDWAHHEDEWLSRIETELTYPVIVKPARLGSSIGIARADDRKELDAAIEDALRYDAKVVVEYAVRDLREINCSILGDTDAAVPSMLEEPVRSTGQELLTYQEKYMRGDQGGAKGAKTSERASGMASLDRMIPAPISAELKTEIEQLGVKIFKLFECAGVARIDFLLDAATGRVYFNEINTIPGSFSFYLWDPAGVAFDALVDRMITIALKRHREKNSRVRSYDVNLLSRRALAGLKGAKK